MATLLDRFKAEKPVPEKPEMTDADRIKKLRADLKKSKAEISELRAELERAEKLMSRVPLNQ